MKMFMLDDKNLTTELDLAGYRKMGVIVKQFSRFDDCHRELKTQRPDVIIINMDFKKIDALSATQYLKQEENTAKIPVVLTSVQSSSKLKNKAVQAGADLFIEQPIPRPYFVEKIKHLLDQKTRAEERLEPKDIRVEVQFGDRSETLNAGDISVGGMLLNTNEELSIGTKVLCLFKLSTESKSIKVEGEVVRIISSKKSGQSGLGIRYTYFHGDSEKKLQDYVRAHSPAQAQLAFYL